MPLILPICTSLLWFLFYTGTGDQKPVMPLQLSQPTCNTAPQVRIVTPDKGQPVSENSAIRYQIKVEDQEDGSSVYGEINVQQVLLEFRYFDDRAKAKRAMEAFMDSDLDRPGLNLIRKSGCMNCHEDKTKLVGPSWKEMADRYHSKNPPVQELASRIKHGSVGNWGQAPMPAHPHLTTGELELAVKFILKQGADSFSQIYSGIEGSFRSVQKAGNEAPGVYLLNASYLDDGCADDSTQAKLGMHSILLDGR